MLSIAPRDGGYPFKFTDEHGLAVCGICLDGLIPHPSACNVGGGPRHLRIYSWPTDPGSDVLQAFDAYLAAPKCTAETHAWFERDRFKVASDAYYAAKEALESFEGREPGWSIT